MLRFPQAPTVWFKDLAHILNTNLIVENLDPVFGNKPDGYPLSAVPARIRQVMETAVEKADSKKAVELFFDTTLTAMANDLSKNLPVVGHKLWIQLLAMSNPQICIVSHEKFATLKTSYFNRQNIGLALLWALGQGGLKDFNVGFRG